MYLENNNNKWIVLILILLGIGAIIGAIMLVNKPQTYKTPAATSESRKVVCRWDVSQIPQDYSVIISLIDKNDKVIRAIPNPSGNSYTFDDINSNLFPTKCKLDLTPLRTSLEACVNDVVVTCQGIPTSTPLLLISPTNTPTPMSTVTPQNPSATPINTPTLTGMPKLSQPIGGPNNPTNTPTPMSTIRPKTPTTTSPTNGSLNQPTKFPELPKAGINMPSMFVVAIGVVILILAFAL